jgi:hypothetical protein
MSICLFFIAHRRLKKKTALVIEQSVRLIFADDIKHFCALCVLQSDIRIHEMLVC